MEETCTGTVTVRLIRSFEQRNIKHVVYKDVDLNQSVENFIEYVNKDIQARTGISPPFKKFHFDTMKISHQPFGAKSSDPVINREDDEGLILKREKTLKECNIVNETEISYFKLEDYMKYQENPHLAW